MKKDHNEYNKLSQLFIPISAINSKPTIIRYLPLSIDLQKRPSSFLSFSSSFLYILPYLPTCSTYRFGIRRTDRDSNSIRDTLLIVSISSLSFGTAYMQLGNVIKLLPWMHIFVKLYILDIFSGSSLMKLSCTQSF